jgi:hypothetical protein
VQALGIGAAADEALTEALERALGAAAAAEAFEVRTDGVRIAARYVLG